MKKILKGVDDYTLQNKPIRHKFTINRVIVYSIHQQWQADLVDMTTQGEDNEDYLYIYIY